MFTQGAQARVELQEQELGGVSRQTLADFVKAHADATASLGNLAASIALLHAAQEAQVSVQRKFERGAADIVELLNGQSAFWMRSKNECVASPNGDRRGCVCSRRRVR